MIPYAMLYAAMAGAPILLVAILESAFLRRHGRPERMVWAVALVLALALPLAVLIRRETGLPPAAETNVPVIRTELGPLWVVPAPMPAAPTASIDWSTTLMALWLTVSTAILARWLVSWLKMRRERRDWSTQWLDGVRVTVTTNLGPGLLGLLRPRILIPSWVVALPTPQRSFVLRHEQEHLRGGDHWLSALARASRLLAPWNPLIWLLANRLGQAMELDCDRRVLRARPDVAGYGATLLLVSEYRSCAAMPKPAFATSDRSLRERIIAMTAPHRSLSAVGVGIAIMIGAALLTAALRVPVPVVAAPAVQLSEILVSPPSKAGRLTVIEPIVASQGVRQSVPGALPAATGPRIQARPEAPQIVATLAEPRLIQDRNREFYLFPGPQRDERPRAVGFPVIGAGNRLLLAPGAETGRYLEDDRLYLLDFTTAIGNSITPIAAPFPGGPPREITELPRIRNSAEIIAAITAAYPAGLRERGLGGTVGMHFLVGEAGEVRETRLTQIAAYEELNGAALRVAPVYRFSPARAGDEYVAVWVSHAIDFRP